MKLIIIRHGDPDYVHDCLTDLGKLQAEAVAPRLASYGITRIITSPQGRARQTAEPLCRLLSMTPQVASWAQEQYVVSKQPAQSGASDEPGEASVVTTVTRVDGEQRIQEIARMLSGSESGTSLDHARELLATSVQ